MVHFHFTESPSLLQRCRIYDLACPDNSAPAHLMPKGIFLQNLHSIATATSAEMEHAALHQLDKYGSRFPSFPQQPLIHNIFITLPISATPPASMVTRTKNKSARPGIPDMTPSQLASAGLLPAQTPRRPPNKPKAGKKLSIKDQQIADLQEELRVAHDTIGHSHDAEGDTDPGTDVDEAVAIGTKRKTSGSIRSAHKLKRSRAMDPFESSSMAHPGATGLAEDWRTRIASPFPPLFPPPFTPPFSSSFTSSFGTPSPMSFDFSTLDYNAFPQSSIGPMSMTPISTASNLSFEGTPTLTFLLPRTVGKDRVYPGIKDLPEHIRVNFRNEFIRFVFKYIANSTSPWTNPDVEALQAIYQIVYPLFPATIRHNDAVFHPTLTSLGVLRNRLAAAAIIAVQEHMPLVFRQKRLKTIETRAAYISKLFESEDDHPIIWREYVEGDIKNHAEVGGYKTVRRGVFQSYPILKTLLSYYSSSGVLEALPTEDPGPGNRPLGALALATTAVDFAYRMYGSGDFIKSAQSFNGDDLGPKTLQYMAYISNDLGERHWQSLFNALSTFSQILSKEEAIKNHTPEEPRGRVPLPPSDPPSPPYDWTPRTRQQDRQSSPLASPFDYLED